MNLFQSFFKGRKPRKAGAGGLIVFGFVLLSALTFACRSGDGNGEDGERGGDDDGRGSGNDGAVTLLDGTLVAGTPGVSGSSSNTLHEPSGIAFGNDGTLYIADMYNFKIRKVTLGDPTITDFAGTGEYGHTDGNLNEAKFGTMLGICISPEGSLYVADGRWVRKITPHGVTSVAGNDAYLGHNESDSGSGPALEAKIRPHAPAYIHGALYVSTQDRIRRFSPDLSTLTIIAGNGGHDSTGDGGLALDAEIIDPFGMDEGPDGSLYFTESSIQNQPGNKVRRIDSSGYISTLDGTDTIGLNSPSALAVASDGTVYISDHNNHRIVKVRNGTSTVIAGGAQGSGSGALDRPRGIAIGPDGWLYVADASNHRIMKYNIN
jgi:sugar lactone lactonase YvrE